MINPITFITDNEFQQDDLLPEENIYFSIRLDPMSATAVTDTYTLFSKNDQPSKSLTLTVRENLRPDSLRDIAAFLFLPSYQRVNDRPLLLIEGEKDLAGQTSETVRQYLSTQGFAETMIQYPGSVPASPTTLIAQYQALLDNPADMPHWLYFALDDRSALDPLLGQLHALENDWQIRNPHLAKMVSVNGSLTQLLHQLTGKYHATENELAIQRQYVEVLRSQHAAKELQDYYNNEYEILPMWYKRFGHIVKVLTGKRTFRSLFRDDVKKYKD